MTKRISTKNNNVIIVDDFPEFITSLNKVLALSDIQTKIFDKPEDFLNYSNLVVFCENCKVLIVDYSMPNLTGYEVYKKIYEKHEGNLPFKMILYSANLEQISDVEKEFLNSIGVEQIKKPNINRLIEKINNGVENALC
jgi:FixJ family two-component response regulator